MVGVRKCCCKYTLWKIDVSDGSIVWKSTLGANANAIWVGDEGGDTMIYECGNAGKVRKVRDDGSSFAELWSVSPGSNELRDVEVSVDDGAVWIVEAAPNTTARRLDPDDGSTLTSATVASDGFIRSGENGDMIFGTNDFYGNLVESFIRRYDSSISLATSTSATNHGPIGGAADGWVGNDPSGGLQRLDSSLSVAATAGSGTCSATPYSSNGTNFAGARADQQDTAGNPQIIGVSSLSEVAEMPDGRNDTFFATWRLDGSSDAYVMASQDPGFSAPFGPKKFLVSDGSEAWFTSMTNELSEVNGTIYTLLAGSLFVAVGLVGTDRVLAFDTSDGSADWQQALNSSNTTAIAVDAAYYGGSLYVCSEVM